MKIPYLDLSVLNSLQQAEIVDAAFRVIRSGQYLNSDEVRAFENRWARHNGMDHCVSTANGLDALTAILVCMRHNHGWKEQDEVIVSAHTFIASFEAITRAGLKPVPCDVDPYTYLIDPTLIEPLITPRTVAIMPVHLYGRVCDMQAITAIAREHNLKVIADACQAHDMTSPDDPGAAAAFSFYPANTLRALGDGGCRVTNDNLLASNARMFCNYGARVKYHHDMQGVNSRLDAMQAAMLSAKLPHLTKQTKQRQDMALYYNKHIKNDCISLPYGGNEHTLSNWHIYPVFCAQRDKLQRHLAKAGVETIIHYPIPPHKQQAYAGLNNLSMPVTERLCAQELSIPLNPTLSAQQQKHIVTALNSFNP